MRFKSILTAGAICAVLAVGPQRAEGQELPKFEVGGQFSLLNFDAETFDGRRRDNYGVGGRFGYNFQKYIAAEAQIDYFPQTDRQQVGPVSFPVFGSKTLAVFGAKAGARNKHFGVFGKARPGFIHFSSVPVFICLQAPCPQPAKTNFALDVGGVFEYYPSEKWLLRFDAGDTIIYHRRFFNTSHNAQISVGVGVRF